MGGYSERREAAVRRALGRHGLRVICLGCGSEGRFWPRDRVEVIGLQGATVFGATRARLRETPCPRCQRLALRGLAWVEAHPELARAASLRHRAVDTALR